MNWMKTYFPALLLLLFAVSFGFGYRQHEAVIKKEEALQAFHYLNKLRQDPSLVRSETGIKDNKIKMAEPLRWNDILARVAEEKALDMATRNYFDHVDKNGDGINIKIHQAGYTLPPEWIKNRRSNYFESLSAGLEDPEEAIRDLIIDEGVNPPGHRHHLLGMTDFNKNLLDCGIGIAYRPGTKYNTYMVVIIAKQTW